jgi:hypothetical protein
MSTNINTKAQETPHLNSAYQGEGGAPTTGVGGGFQSGNSANMGAILAFIAAYMELMSKKNDAYVAQAQAENTAANETADSQVALGDFQATEYAALGATSIGAGLFSFGSGCGGDDEQLKAKQNEIDESRGFVSNLDKVPPRETFISDGNDTETTAVKNAEDSDPNINGNNEEQRAKQETEDQKHFTRMLGKVESGNYEMTEGKGSEAKAAELKGQDKEVYQRLDESDRLKFKQALNKHIDGQQAKVNAETSELKDKTQRRMNKLQGASQLSQGAGNLAQSTQKTNEAQAEANTTEFRTALDGFQSLKKSTDGQAEKDLQAAEQLTQVIVEIDKSNNAILSA